MKYLILGAGPTGLAFANKLKEMGEDSFLVLEKEKEAGGLCRSAIVDGTPLDIGGGHFLDVRRPRVNAFLFQFMPEQEWDRYVRNSQIHLGDSYINSPIEANIWQMELGKQVEYLKEIAVAGCNMNEEKPERFVDWIYWKLGKKIATEYMLPYNRKMFADELNELGTYWLEKLPNVSFEETLRSCLTHKAYGSQPGHAEFFYPKHHGYGELWLRMADKIKDHIVYQADIIGMDFTSKTVKTRDNKLYQAERIICTVPWNVFKFLDGIPEELKKSISKLKSSSIEVRYFSEDLDTDAQWIYEPDEKLAYHRILVRHNFCPESRGYWTETRAERMKLFSHSQEGSFSYLNQYAYPLNTVDKPVIMGKLLKWCKERNIYGLGRWGEHQHYNSDVTVERALDLAETLYFGR